MTKQIKLSMMLIAGALCLASCAVKPPPERVADITTAKPAQLTEENAAPDLPLTTELMYYILGAEMAEQRGNVSLAAEMYHAASKLVRSQSVARRSAGLATQSQNFEMVERAMARWVELEPESAEAQMVTASVAITQKDLEKAHAALATAVKIKPEEKGNYFAEITGVLANTKQMTVDESLDFVVKTDAYQQGDPDALFAYARLAGHFKKFDLALIALNKILKSDPHLEGAILLKTDILSRQGKKVEGLALLTKASKRKGVSDDLLQAYAQALVSNGENTKAIALLKSLHEKNPENEQVVLTLGLLSMDLKEYKQAKGYFSEVMKLGDSRRQAAYFMGLAAEESGDKKLALTWFAAVPPESRHFYAAQGRYVNILADQGQMHDARQHFVLLRKATPEAAAGYYGYEATFLREHGQDQAAFDIYTEGLTQFPDNTDLRYGRAMVAEPLNKLDTLESDLKQVLALEPNNADALNALGYTLADKTDRYQEAKELIVRAIAVRPQDPYFLDSMGWVQYRLGNLAEAVLYLRRAIDLQPDAEMLAHLGEVLWQQGKKQEAEKVWQQAREKAPNNSLLKETIQRMNAK